MTAATFGTFGGLDVVTDPLDVGADGAVDAVNVDLDRRGLLRSRDGLTAFSSFTQGSAASNPFTAVHELHDGNVLAYAGAGPATLYAVGTSGAALATQTTGFGAPTWGVTSYSTPTAGFTFISSGNTPTRWDGSVFAVPTYTGTQPGGAGLAVTPWDNRLVNFAMQGNVGPTDVNRVLFSDATDPLTFSANNFVSLVTGGTSGSTLKGGNTFANRLFLFSQRRLFIFYGTSIQSDGTPVFNYLTIDTPYSNASVGPTVTGPDGVYVLTSEGLYRTQGGAFQLVSDTIAPILKGNTGAYSSTLPSLTLLGVNNESSACVDGRLYFTATTGSFSSDPTHILVWDTKLSQWLLWSTTYEWLASVSNRRAPRLLVSQRGGSSANPILYLDQTATTDNGTAIASRYKSGRYPLTDRGNVAETLESRLIGTGTVTFLLETDKYTAATHGAGASQSVALGIVPVSADGWFALDQEGGWFQHTISASVPWTLESVTHYISAIRDGY